MNMLPVLGAACVQCFGSGSSRKTDTKSLLQLLRKLWSDLLASLDCMIIWPHRIVWSFAASHCMIIWPYWIVWSFVSSHYPIIWPHWLYCLIICFIVLSDHLPHRIVGYGRNDLSDHLPDCFVWSSGLIGLLDHLVSLHCLIIWPYWIVWSFGLITLSDHLALLDCLIIWSHHIVWSSGLMALSDILGSFHSVTLWLLSFSNLPAVLHCLIMWLYCFGKNAYDARVFRARNSALYESGEFLAVYFYYFCR